MVRQDFPAPVFSRIFKQMQLRDFKISQNIILWKCVVFFVSYLESFGVSKAKNWFWESRTYPNNPKIMQMKGFRVFPK